MNALINTISEKLIILSLLNVHFLVSIIQNDVPVWPLQHKLHKHELMQMPPSKKKAEQKAAHDEYRVSIL